MATSVPPGKQTFLDPETGALLSLGTVTHYIPSTTLFKNTWADEDQTEVNTNPIVLDATGSCSIWGSGLYRQILKDSAGNVIWDLVTGFVGGGAGGGDVFGPGSSTPGHIVLWNDTDGTSIDDGGASLGPAQGGTGATSVPTNGQLPIGNGTNYVAANITAGTGITVVNGAGTITLSASGGSGTVTSVAVSGGTTGLTTSGGPITGAGTITLTGTLGVANGGTGLAATPANGQLLIGNGTNYTLATLTAGSGCTITNGAGTITIAFTGGGSGTVTSVSGSGGTTGLTLTGGPITGSGTLTLGGTLALANGGTGATTAAGAVAAIGAEPAATLFAINTQTASYTLVLGDAGKTVEMNVGSANNLTIPLNATVAFPTNTRIDVVQIGAGQTTILATGGVTILSYLSYVKMTGQYAGATLYKRATDTWVLMGNLSA